LWATWCGDCRRAIPELNSFQEKFGKDLVIIGLSDEPVEKLKPFLSTNDVKYLIGTDTKKTLKSFLKVKGIPHIVILTPDNVVRWQGPPGDPSDLLTEDLVAGIIETSKEKNANAAKFAMHVQNETPDETKVSTGEKKESEASDDKDKSD
jgi:hypothetical protein